MVQLGIEHNSFYSHILQSDRLMLLLWSCLCGGINRKCNWTRAGGSVKRHKGIMHSWKKKLVGEKKKKKFYLECD